MRHRVDILALIAAELATWIPAWDADGGETEYVDASELGL